MTDAVIIPRRFCGPPDSGNGGWTCGTLASFVEEDAVVTLRMPPPLETALDVEERDDAVHLLIGDALVAEARPTTIDVTPPMFVPHDEAVAAAERYAGHDFHPFGTCFTCGPDRPVGDGLRIFPGPVDGAPALRACAWLPDESLVVDGSIPEAVVWAALDCPSGWTHLGDGTVAVLGRMAAHIERIPVAGESYVVVGEATGVDGRKRFATSGLFGSDGVPLAWADTTWITIDA
jgi:hypothetical protein